MVGHGRGQWGRGKVPFCGWRGHPRDPGSVSPVPPWRPLHVTSNCPKPPAPWGPLHPNIPPTMCHPGVPVSPLSMSPVPSPATQIPHLPRVHVPPLSPPLYPDVPCPPPCTLSPHVPCSVSPVPPQPPESTLGSVSLLSPQVPWASMSSVPLQSLLSSLCPLCHPRLPEPPTPLGSLPPHVPSHSGVPRPFTSPVPDVPTRRGVPVSPWHCSDSGGPAVALFSLVGFVQMAIWAQGKHRSYLREFRDYPPLRSPIIPFLL